MVKNNYRNNRAFSVASEGSFDSVWTIENVNIENNSKIHTFDEAIEVAGIGRFQHCLTIICGICIMGVVVEGIVLGFVIPSAKCDLKFSVIEQGVLNSVGFIGIILTSYFWGFLADTWGRLKVLRYSLLFSICCSIISSFSTSVCMLIIMRLFVGMFISGVQATAFSYLGEFHGNRTRIRAVTYAAMFMPLACVYLPAIAWLIVPMQWEWPIFGMIYTPWRLLILIASIMNVVPLIAFQFLPESPKFLLSMDKIYESIDVLKIVYHMNTGQSKKTYYVINLKLENRGRNINEVEGVSDVFKLIWNQTWPLFVPPYLSNTFKLSFLMFILFSIGHGTYMWTPEIFTAMITFINDDKTLCEAASWKYNNLPSATINFDYIIGIDKNITNTNGMDSCAESTNPLTYQILLGIGAVFALIYAFMALYIDRIGRKLLLTIWLTMTAAACLALVWSSNFYLTVTLVVLFLSCGLCASVLSAISVDLFPTNIRAMALCLILMFGRVGSVAGSYFVASLIELNCSIIFYSYTGLILVCVGVCFFIKTK